MVKAKKAIPLRHAGRLNSTATLGHGLGGVVKKAWGSFSPTLPGCDPAEEAHRKLLGALSG